MTPQNVRRPLYKVNVFGDHTVSVILCIWLLASMDKVLLITRIPRTIFNLIDFQKDIPDYIFLSCEVWNI